jgi:hypothetical protein
LADNLKPAVDHGRKKEMAVYTPICTPPTPRQTEHSLLLMAFFFNVAKGEAVACL